MSGHPRATMLNDLDFYQSHLDRVSRSFAFCIRRLSPPMRGWTALAYLLCRVLDTVEDSIWPESGLGESQFRELESFVRGGVQGGIHGSPDRAAVDAWALRFPAGIPEGERALLMDAHLLFDDLHRGLPAEVRGAMQQTVLRMSGGMRHYFASRGESGELSLSDLNEVNRYCYFVAGIVGELLTRLFLASRPDFRPGPGFLKNAFHFGLFLQKVNLLKDQRTDESEGRRLIPDRRLVLASLRENAEGAIGYLTAIPADELGYRVFCGWSLFLGLASLPWIEQAFVAAGAEPSAAASGGGKLPRVMTQELMAAVEELVKDDAAIRASFAEYAPLFPEPEPEIAAREGTGTSAGGAWFSVLAGGVLGDAELAELRVWGSST